jgi:hypothetical protein
MINRAQGNGENMSIDNNAGVGVLLFWNMDHFLSVMLKMNGKNTDMSQALVIEILQLLVAPSR